MLGLDTNVLVRFLVRDHEVHFHQLERKTSARIRHQKISEKTGKEVES